MGITSMKKVAMISDGWKRLITYAWVDGIMRYIRESEEDICLYQYNCHGNWSKDEKHNHGEYNIYQLPELSMFDGIIMDCINIIDREQFEKTVEMIKASKVPTVSIASDIEGFYYAGIDNKKTITEVMEHLFTVHNCRSFIFAGGPEGNFENRLRIQAFRECLDAFGLSKEDNPVWYGDYDFATGVKYFERMQRQLKTGKAFLPDAFVCANDNIAAGLIYKAQRFGYSIPRDFRVTGFDNLDKAIYFDPQITTVGLVREVIGYKCIDILMDIWDGKDVPKNHFIPSSCVFTESCGCPNSGLLNYREYAKNQIIGDVDKLRNEEDLIIFESEIIKHETYEEIFHKIAEYFMSLECDGYFVVVDKQLYEGDDAAAFMTEGYDLDRMVVVCAADNKQFLEIDSVSELFEYLEQHGSGSAYMFTPIHFREHAVGFTVMKNGKFLYDNPYFYDIHNTITKTIENVYKKLQLEAANRKLRDIYNRDQMTGLYNRIAYTEMIEPEYHKYCERKQKCALMFLDADYFKEINDRYGHEKGDEILKQIARVLMEHCPENGYVYRFGGDEFIVFFPCDDEAGVFWFREQVNEALRAYNISVSMGVTVTDPCSGKKLDDYLKLADQDMYRVKTAKKALRE